MKNLIIAFLSMMVFYSCKKEDEIPVNNMAADSASKAISANASSLFGGYPAIGIANNEYGKPGPYTVKTDAVRGDCKLVMGLIYKVAAATGIIAPNVQCNPQFPSGIGFPVATEVWYPSNIRELGRLPVVNLVGGITSNLGNYDTYARLWASHGFIVVNTNDFINLAPFMHTLGAIEASLEDKKPGSDLQDRVDLTKMIVVGHSAGAGAAITVSSFAPSVFQLIDTRIRVVASVPIQPSIITSSSVVVKTPTLYLAAEKDEINGRFATLNYYNLHPIIQPAWFATAKDASHFSPVRALEKNEYAGIITAWLLYFGKDDPAAKGYFVGSGYRLQQDQQYILKPANILDPIPKLYGVKRNLAANNVR